MTREMRDFILLTFIIDLEALSQYFLFFLWHKQLFQVKCKVRQHFENCAKCFKGNFFFVYTLKLLLS